MSYLRVSCFLCCLVMPASPVVFGEVSSGTPVTFDGAIHEPEDISAIGKVGDFLLIGSDEGHVIQLLQRQDHDSYRLKKKFTLPKGKETDKTEKSKPELDIEGIATNGRTVYIVGSHSRKRSKVKAGKSSAKNRHRLTENLPEKSRRCIFRIEIDDEGNLKGKPKAQYQLYDYLQQDAVLQPFTKVPSKENGVDIEGIAAKGKMLYIGFRGPVLRDNWTPVLVIRFDDPSDDAEVLFVNLNGLGIRDITRVKTGFLILAGPVGDGPGRYELHHWNGKDCIPDEDEADGKTTKLGCIPTAAGGKAEGITVIDETDDAYEIIVVWDSLDRGAPKRFSVDKM